MVNVAIRAKRLATAMAEASLFLKELEDQLLTGIPTIFPLLVFTRAPFDTFGIGFAICAADGVRAASAGAAIVTGGCMAKVSCI